MPTNDKLKQFFKSRLQDKQFQHDLKQLKSDFVQYQHHIDNILRRTYAHLNIEVLGTPAQIEYRQINAFIRKMSRIHYLYAFGGQEDYVLLTWIDSSYQWVVQISIEPIQHLETINIVDALRNEKDQRLFVANIHRNHAFGQASHQDVKNEVLSFLRASHMNHHITE